MTEASETAVLIVKPANMWWMEGDVAVLLMYETIVNIVYGVGDNAIGMKALCAVVGDDIIRKTISAATTYMYNSNTGRTTEERAIFVLPDT